MTITEVIKTVEAFADVSPDMSVATVLTFLYVGRRGVCIQKDVEKELGLSNAAASRNINYWCVTGSKKLEFIERYEDADDRRYNRLRLTRKGQGFLDRLLGVYEDAETTRH